MDSNLGGIDLYGHTQRLPPKSNIELSEFTLLH